MLAAAAATASAVSAAASVDLAARSSPAARGAAMTSPRTVVAAAAAPAPTCAAATPMPAAAAPAATPASTTVSTRRNRRFAARAGAGRAATHAAAPAAASVAAAPAADDDDNGVADADTGADAAPFDPAAFARAQWEALQPHVVHAVRGGHRAMAAHRMHDMTDQWRENVPWLDRSEAKFPALLPAERKYVPSRGRVVGVISFILARNSESKWRVRL